MRDEADASEAVVCIHGLWLHGLATWFMRQALRRHGYTAYAFSYPSVRRTLRHNAEALAAFVDGLPHAKVHLVGHSLGGLVIAAALPALRRASPGKLGRVVFCGTPYATSTAGEQLLERKWGAHVVGQSLPDWLNLPEKPIWPSEVTLGIIAGTRAFGAGSFVAKVPLPHDGTVRVAETVVPGMAAQLLLPVTHTQLLTSATVARHIAYFLRSGTF